MVAALEGGVLGGHLVMRGISFLVKELLWLTSHHGRTQEGTTLETQAPTMHQTHQHLHLGYLIPAANTKRRWSFWCVNHQRVVCLFQHP